MFNKGDVVNDMMVPSGNAGITKVELIKPSLKYSGIHAGA